MKMIFLAVCGGFALAGSAAYLTAQEPAPIETCGTDVPKSMAELRAVACPEGWVGQWSQERPANSCDWQPLEPRWYSCSQIIEPQNGPDTPPIDPEFEEHDPIGPREGPAGATTVDGRAQGQ